MKNDSELRSLGHLLPSLGHLLPCPQDATHTAHPVALAPCQDVKELLARQVCH